MQGPDMFDPELKGVTPRLVEELFQRVSSAPETQEFTIRASYLELYLEKIRDLLDPTRTNLRIREDKTKGKQKAETRQGAAEARAQACQKEQEYAERIYHRRSRTSRLCVVQREKNVYLLHLLVPSRNVPPGDQRLRNNILG